MFGNCNWHSYKQTHTHKHKTHTYISIQSKKKKNTKKIKTSFVRHISFHVKPNPKPNPSNTPKKKHNAYIKTIEFLFFILFWKNCHTICISVRIDALGLSCLGCNSILWPLFPAYMCVLCVCVCVV